LDGREFARRGDGVEHVGFGTGGQDVAPSAGHVMEDMDDLLGGLSGAEDHLGKAPPQVAVVVDAGELKVLERQVAQAVKGISNAETAGLHLLEDLLYLVRAYITPRQLR